MQWLEGPQLHASKHGINHEWVRVSGEDRSETIAAVVTALRGQQDRLGHTLVFCRHTAAARIMHEELHMVCTHTCYVFYSRCRWFGAIGRIVVSRDVGILSSAALCLFVRLISPILQLICWSYAFDRHCIGYKSGFLGWVPIVHCHPAVQTKVESKLLTMGRGVHSS